MPSFKQKLTQSKDRLTMHVCTIPSATVPQAMAAAGADAVIIDMEHGAVDHASAHAMIAATAGTECAPIIRIEKIDDVLVKRVLDLGAEGICFPMARTAEDARAAVASMRYPPAGTRGFGPFIAQSRWGTDLAGYRSEIEPELICVLLIETGDAIRNIDAICAVEGIDLIVPAPFDLSTDLGIPGQFDHPDFQAALSKVEAAANAAGIPLGTVALTQPQAEAVFARGYRVIAGFDLIWLREKTMQVQDWTQA